ncbi:MAG: hypothetical protein OHK0013_24930 [Sandaracinaceae bacterium]
MSSPQALLRFLALIERELGASEARLELSAHDPPEGTVWAPMAHGFRVVARFASDGPDIESARSRLQAIVESFAGVLAEAALPVVREGPPTPNATLEEALDLLAHRARAESAWVIDDSTPEIWGGSLPHDFDVRDALRVARVAALGERLGATLGELARLGEGLRAFLAARDVVPEAAQEIERDLDALREAGPLPDGAVLRAQRALAAVRNGTAGPADQLFVRRFAGIYELVLVFAGPHSELHAEAAVLRALPLIERLVASLPPRDPVATGAKVAVLRRLRRV